MLILYYIFHRQYFNRLDPLRANDENVNENNDVDLQRFS